MLMAKLSEGTRPSYQSHWKQWALFRGRAQKSPYLRGGGEAQRQSDEDALLDFIVFLAKLMQMRSGSITQRLFAIRHGHLMEGLADPIIARSRVWSAIGGLKRLEDPVKRKHAV